MATGSIVLSVMAAAIPDGSSNNAAPARYQVKGTNSAPARFAVVAAFDATADEHLWWVFTVPDNYASGGTLRLLWAAAATANAVVWAASVGAVTAGDADTPLEHAQAAATTATTNVNTTESGRLTETTISPAVDSMAPDDLVTIVVYRDANHASDTCTVDAVLWSVVFEYTTT